jgi:peptide/nickel transport system substrate-binding protein
VAVNEDPKNWWEGVNGGGGGGSRELSHLVNQYLASIEPDGHPIPRLLAELPSMETGTWKVSPDGTMEVTYKLRSDVKWHDGTPFTADDVVFSWEMGRDPGIPNGNAAALKLISGIVATDPQTAVATYSAPYGFADRLEHRELFPVPKHLVEQPYRENKETVLGMPFFAEQYVGLGPFKVTSWEHGSTIELAANDAYFLGRPKLDRIRVQIIPDPSTAIANIQAGAVNVFLPTGGPSFDQLQTLRHAWMSNGQGTVVTESIRWRYAEPQKSALAQPADLTDPRMRQAMLMDIDRLELSRSLLEDLAEVADSWVNPKYAIYPQVKDAITAYPFDQRRAAALFAEVGWTPGSDGILQKGGTPLKVAITYDADQEKDAAIIQQQWKAGGIDSDLQMIPNAMLRDAEFRATYTGVQLAQNPAGALSAYRRFASDQIPSTANRWAGTNRGSFNNSEWDDVGKRLRNALNDKDRLDLERDLLKVFSAQLPTLPIQYEIQAVPVTGLKNFRPITGVPHTGNIMHTTNAYEWDLGK